MLCTKEFYKKAGLLAIPVFFIFFIMLQHQTTEVLPDYEKTMQQIAISIDKSFLEGDDLQKTPLVSLVETLGDSDIYLFSNIKTDTLPYFLQEKVIEYVDSINNFWLQDSFEVINKNTIIIPNNDFLVFNPEIHFKDFSRLGRNIIQTPFYFEGGNLFVVRLPDNKPVIMIGYGSVVKTASQLALYKKLPQKVAEQRVQTEIKNFFWKQFKMETVFLGDTIEDSELFHIDQAMLFLDNENVILARYNGEKFLHIKNQLERYNEQLLQLGYNVYYLNYDDEMIEKKNYYLNGLIFTKDGTQKIIFPSFPDYSRNQEVLTFLQNILSLYEIVFIEDTFFHTYNGGFHCVVNPLI